MNLQGTLLCGKQVAAKIYENLQLVDPQPDEKSQYGLDVILVGERSDSKLYVSMKSKNENLQLVPQPDEKTVWFRCNFSWRTF